MPKEKLSTVLAKTEKVAKQEISSDEAAILVKIGMSGADVNDKARKAMNYYLEALTLKNSIDDDEAKVCYDILKQSSTVEQKNLCNQVLAIYLSKFDFAQPGAYKAERVAKAAAAKESAVAA